MTPEKRDNLILLINRIMIILIIFITFFLGRYSIPIEREISAPFRIVDDQNTKEIQGMIDIISEYDNLKTDNDLERLKKGKIISATENYLFVASSRGSKYYKKDGKEAKKLSEKNKVYFKTELEAEKEGFKKGF